MKKIEVFDPAMCCSTGVCGPSVDPDLLRISTVFNNLKNKGYEVVRHNLSEEPLLYSTTEVVSKVLKKEGVRALPITLLDGEVAKSGSYPTNKELSEWLGVNQIELTARKIKKTNTCCGGDTECC